MTNKFFFGALALLLLVFPAPALGATPTTCPTLTRTLALGTSGTDVIALQQFLVAQSLLSADSATGYFGTLTQGAVQKFQASRNVVSSGIPASTGYGVVGVGTRAAIALTCTGSTTPVEQHADGGYVREHGLLLIASSSSPSPFIAKIYRLNADGSNKILLTDKGAMPSWTPDGKIIFVSERSGSPQIWMMDENAGNAKQVGTLPSNKPPTFPQMAKNGLVAFTSVEDSQDNNGIWVMQKDGSGLKEIARGNQPSLALTGTWLTYTYETADPYHRQIWRINTDGTNKKQLTFLGDPDYPDANASNISPDEKWVAFFSGKESDKGDAGYTQDPATWGHRNVAVIPAAGGTRRTITPCKPLQQATADDCIAADNPTWSPDSHWILYDTDKPGIWMSDINGASKQRLYSEGKGAVRVPLKYIQSSSTPTATLTANGTSDITVNVGDTINYLWSSTNGISATATYTIDSTACGLPATGSASWITGLSGGGPGTLHTCEGGHTYTFRYTVAGTNGQTATATLIVRVRATSAAAPFRHTLARGWTGEEVTILQATLGELGFYAGEITGYFGEKTEAAVKSLQIQNNVAAVGIVGPQTRDLLQRLLGAITQF